MLRLLSLYINGFDQRVVLFNQLTSLSNGDKGYTYLFSDGGFFVSFSSVLCLSVPFEANGASVEQTALGYQRKRGKPVLQV